MSAKFTNYNLEQLTEACRMSLCWADVCRNLSINNCYRNVTKIKTLVKENDISTDHFDINATFGRNKENPTRKGPTKGKYSKEELEQAISESMCWSDVCRNLGVSVCTFNINRTRSQAEEYKISSVHFDPIRTMRRGKRTWTAEDVFVEDCDISRSGLRPVLIRLGFYTGKCSECGSPDEWNGKPLIIEIDHINGNHRDNRKDNLRWLCPNCHSQTDTYRSRTKILNS